MKIQFWVSFMMIMTVLTTNAKTMFQDSDTAKSEVEIGVEGIQRLCPTGVWDHWTFRDIMFDRESNTVLLIVQLNSWSDRKEEKSKQATAADALKQAEWIVSNFKAGYEDLIAEPQIICDGDFMLYLSVGTLFKQMEKNRTNLRIMLLKPDYAAQVFGDIPLDFSSEQIKKVSTKE